ncbi:MAG: hypothetical protein HYV75_06535, partial [Opitutae bacterium]|nr:hypothetical protein [Opitutae bacterium]
MKRTAADPFSGVLTAAQFDALAARHRRATGLNLCGCDADGRLRRGRGERGSCVQDEACRPFRAQAIAEAAR